MKRITLALILAFCSCWASAACYSVHDAQQKLVYQAQTTPVDLSRRLGDTVPARFGRGATMLVDAVGTDCEPVGTGDRKQPAPFAWMDEPEPDPLVTANSWPATPGSPVVAGRGRLGYPHVGPRGGRYRITSGGNRAYMPRR